MIKSKPKGFLNTGKINYAGRHIILDLWGARFTNNERKIKQVLKEAVSVAKSTLISIQTHKYSPHGFSAIALVSESHISIHTWPEYKYIAIDIFTCGEKTDPYAAVNVFKNTFKPKKVEIVEIKRGIKL
ncbi:adenosylmethionine decarboxylase [bacterium]|nr:adenosylmethionine decarboxylase [bacterium]